MYNMFVYSFFMFFLFMVSFVSSIIIFSTGIGLTLEWLLFSVNSVNVEMFLLVDWISLLFISIVLLISSMVMLYSIIYMTGDKNLTRFYLLVFMFIISMIMMIISPNLISILLGWDGLGLVSYCLVIYYQNFYSYNSGMVTVLSNRVGDVGLLMSIALMLAHGCWNSYLMNLVEIEDYLIIFFLFMAAITKSAQIPFSYWLPLAMAAPTPVSSLVHSSTLVTAGVYLMIRFNDQLWGSGISLILLVISVLTSFMSGLMANFEYDLKKIVALSTLSQLGLMMMIISIGLGNLAFYHLITHALFKSLLFLCSGAMIHSMMNNQDIRFYGGLNEFMPFVMMSFYIASFALCGVPFMAGFYSKDLIMEMFYLYQVNVFILFLSVMSLAMTVSYTVRLVYYMFYGGGVMFYSSWFNFTSESLMNISMFILLIFSTVSGSILSWMIFFDLYEPLLSLPVKLVTLVSCLSGVSLGLLFYGLKLINFYSYIYFMSTMWMTMFFYSYMYKPMMVSWDVITEVDKTWMEFTMKIKIIYLMESFKFIFLGHYKMYMMSVIVLVFMFIMLLF